MGLRVRNMNRLGLLVVCTLSTTQVLCAEPTRASYFASSRGTPVVVYEYTKSDRRLSWGGYPAPRSGAIFWDVDSASGKIRAIQMLQSTGDSRLDDVALRIAHRWRFKPGTVSKVRAPVVFTKRGIIIG